DLSEREATVVVVEVADRRGATADLNQHKDDYCAPTDHLDDGPGSARNDHARHDRRDYQEDENDRNPTDLPERGAHRRIMPTQGESRARVSRCGLWFWLPCLFS